MKVEIIQRLTDRHVSLPAAKSFT